MKTREKITYIGSHFSRVIFLYLANKNPKQSSVLILSQLTSRLEKSTKISPKKRLMIWIRQKKKTSQQMPAKIPKPTSFQDPSLTENAALEKKQTNSTANLVENKTQKSVSDSKTRSNDVQEHLNNYLLAVKKTGCSSSTIRNYKSDINQFLDFLESNNINDLRNKPKLLAFAHYQRDKGLKESSIKRKLVSITQFKLWLKQEGLLASEIPLSILGQAKTETETLERKIIDKDNPNKEKEAKQEQTPEEKIQKKSKAPKNRLFIFLNLLALFLFLGGLAYFAYQQFGQAIISMAYPSTPTEPNKVLSYQGRLTDTAQNPITIPTDMTYKLYDADSDGNLLWSSNTCSIDPDQDGIFNANLGAGSGTGSDNENCGGEIADSVFTENTNVWLEVSIGSETLTPRQPIRTVAYAINSSTLQGLRPAEIATNSTILMMNSDGEVVLGTDNPVIKTAVTSSGMTLESNQITIQTTSGSNGNIVLAPDGTGSVDIQGNLSVSGTSTLVGNTYITSPNTLIFGGTTALGEITSPTDSGAYLIGAYDEFDYSNSTNVQGVLNDLDSTIAGLAAGTTGLWTDSGSLTYLTSTADDWAVGGNSLASALSLDVSANTLRLGSGSTADSVLNMYASDGDTGSLTYNTNDSWIFEGGNIGIGVTNPSAKLSFAQDTTAAGGIDFGGDTNLYRVYTNTLQTDSEFWSTSKIGVNTAGASTIDLNTSSNTAVESFRFLYNSLVKHQFGNYTGNNDFFIDSYDSSNTKKTSLTINADSLLFNIDPNQEGWKMTFGGDTNLYRSAADQLKTDDSLYVGTNFGLGGSGYINWGSTAGSTGYGIRDNSGTIEYKNSGGDWAAVGSGSGGGSWSELTDPTSSLALNMGIYDSTFSWNSGNNFAFDGNGNVTIGPLSSTGMEVSSNLFVGRAEGDYGAGKAGIYAYRLGNTVDATSGSDWSLDGVDTAITGYSEYGNEYSAGIAGYSRLDYANSAAIIGGDQDGSVWGSLGYKDENSNEWAGYFNGNGTYAAAFMNGNVGIGTITPASKLDVNGTVQMTGIKMTTSPADGYVLTSDSSGNGTWTDLSSTAGPWTLSGSNLYPDSTSYNVGIGTNTPGGKLDVTGGMLAIDNGDLGTPRGIRFRETTDTTTPSGAAIYQANNNNLYLQAGSANYINLRDYSGSNQFSFNTSNAVLGIGTAGGGLKPSTSDSTTAIQIKDYSNNAFVDFDSTNHRVGIGTTLPIFQTEIYGAGQLTAALADSGNRTGILAINGNSTSTGAGGAIVFGNSSSHTANSLGFAAIKGLLTDSTANTIGDLAFSTRNSTSDTALTERMRITASGFVGIGTDNPNEMLMVNGSINAEKYYDLTNKNYYLDPAAVGIGLKLAGSAEIAGNIGIGTASTSYKLSIGGSTSVISNLSGDITIDPASGNLSLSGNNLINVADGSFANGYFSNSVGIGTTSPYSGISLDVNGSISTGGSGTSDGAIRIRPADAGSWFWIDTPSGGSLRFSSGGTAGTNPMVFTNSGRLGIGTTSPSYPLDVSGSIRSSGEIITTSANAFRMIQGNYGAFWRNDGASTYFLLTASGDQYGSWNTLRPITISNSTGYVTFGNGYGDLAENYRVSGKALRGTMVSIGSTNPSTAISSSTTYPSLLGVISTDPGAVMDVDGGFQIGLATKTEYTDEKAPIALTGAVPALVTSQNGAIKIGDAIGISNISGFGTKMTSAGQIVGKALEKFDTNSCSAVSSVDSIVWPEDDGKNSLKPCYRLPDGTYVGKIMVAVSPSWYDPAAYLQVADLTLDENGDVVISGNDPESYAIATPTGLTNRIAVFADLFTARLQAGYIKTKELVTNTFTATSAYIAELTAPIIKTNTITSDNGQIDIVSDATISGSLAVNTDLYVNNNIDIDGNLNVAGESKLGELIANNATISGTLSADNIEANNLEANDATISGTLRADNIEAGSISADIITGLRERLSEQIAETLTQPTLLASLFEQQTTQTDEYLNQLSQEINTASDSAALDASDSASLAELDDNAGATFIADNAFINKYFEVNGSAFISNSLKLGENLMVGDNTVFGDNYISYQPVDTEDFTFYIQPSGMGKLSLMAGLMELDHQGFITINGDLKVAGVLEVGDDLKVNGTLLTSLISAENPGEDIQVQLASTQEGTDSATVQESNFEFIDENQTPVATVSANGDLALTGSLRINQNPTVATESGELKSGRSAGQATLEAGAREITISSDKVEENSMIYVTPLNSTDNQVLYVKNKVTDSPFTPENDGQFTVAIDYALSHNVTFNWWIVQLN